MQKHYNDQTEKTLIFYSTVAIIWILFIITVISAIRIHASCDSINSKLDGIINNYSTDIVETTNITDTEPTSDIDTAETTTFEDFDWSSVTDWQDTVDIPNVSEKYKTEIPYIVKTVYGEARICSTTEQAAVVWCILNRVDYYNSDIVSIVTASNQFYGYSKNHPVDEDIRLLVIDILERWEWEKAGGVNIGRVLPKEYMWFWGDGRHNYFRDSYRGGNIWKWEMESPYV